MFQYFLVFCIILMKILQKQQRYWTSKNVKTFSKFYYQNFIPTNRENLRLASKKFLIYGSFRFSNKILTIQDNDLIQHIFIRNKDAIGKSFSIYPGSSIMKEILPHLDSKNWKRLKNLMIRGFSTKNLKNYQIITEDITKTCLNSVI